MRISDWSSDVCSSDLFAERIAAKYGFSRDDLDRFALESHHRAAAATTRGDFADEIVPLTIQTPEGEQQHKIDEGIRFDATLDGIGEIGRASCRERVCQYV